MQQVLQRGLKAKKDSLRVTRTFTTLFQSPISLDLGMHQAGRPAGNAVIFNQPSPYH